VEHLAQGVVGHQRALVQRNAQPLHDSGDVCLLGRWGVAHQRRRALGDVVGADRVRPLGCRKAQLCLLRRRGLQAFDAAALLAGEGGCQRAVLRGAIVDQQLQRRGAFEQRLQGGPEVRGQRVQQRRREFSAARCRFDRGAHDRLP